MDEITRLITPLERFGFIRAADVSLAVGLVIGAGLFAVVYPRVSPVAARTGKLPWKTVGDLLGGVNSWFVVVPAVALILAVLWMLEYLGL